MADTPKRIGRPPSQDPFGRMTLNLRASEFTALDRVRGDVSRHEFIRKMLVERLTPAIEPTPEQLAPVKRATVAKIEAAFGPVKSAPGSRLKKG